METQLYLPTLQLEKRDIHMKAEKIKVITIEDFKDYPELIVYMDENIGILNGFNVIIQKNHDIAKLGCMLIAFCEEGEIMCSINGHQYLLQKDYCAILPPGTIICPHLPNTSHTIKVVAFEQSFLTDTLSFKKETWEVMHFLYKNPIFPINRTASYKMYLYKELLLTLIKEESHAYSKQTRRHHLRGMICEMFALLNQLVPEHIRKDINRTRSTYVVRDFVELVNADDGSHRSVSYYADRLCYSAKYLSTIVKEITGETPLQIINKHAIQQIKYRLKHSSLSIKEIADSFDFANPSFFGKFVKAYTGMSPQQYRTSDEK